MRAYLLRPDPYRRWNGWAGFSWTKQPYGWTFLLGLGPYGIAFHTGQRPAPQPEER